MSYRFSRLIDRVHFLGLLAAVVLVTLVFNVENQNIVIFKPILAQSLAFFLFALWLIDSIERGKFQLVPTALDSPIVLYFLWLVATVVISPNFLYFSLEELNRYASVFLFYFLAQKTLRYHTRLNWCLWVLFGVSLIATSYGLLQYNGIHLIEWGRSVLVSTFGNKNFFTGFLVITTPVIFGYALATPKIATRVILVILGIIQLEVILLTETRTGFLATLVGVTVFLGLAIRFIWWPRVNNWRIQLATGLTLLVVSGFIIYFHAPNNLKRRLGRAFDLQIGTGRVRWIMWTGSTRAALDKPLSGQAHGAFQLVFPYYRPTFYHRFRVSHNTRHSHNEFLEVLMETGVVGLSLFLLIFVILGVVTYRFLKRNNSWFYQWLIIGFVSSVAASLAQNFASVNLRWMSSTLLFWLIVSFIPVTIRIASGTGTHPDKFFKKDQSINRSYRLLPPLSWKTSVFTLICLILTGAGYGFYNLIQSDFKLKTTNAMIRAAERRRISWQRAARMGQQAVRHNPFNLSARYKLGYIYLKQPNYRKAFKAYDRLTDLAPNYAQIHNNIALIHESFGQPYRSLLHFEWATHLEDNIRNHRNLARRHSNEGLRNRSILHGLSIPRIFNENQRNAAHKSFIKASNRNFESMVPVARQLKQLDSKLHLSLFFLADKFRTFNQSFSRYTEMRAFLVSPSEKNTERRVLNRFQEKEPVDPLSFLVLTEMLREDEGHQVTTIRRSYLKVLSDWMRRHPNEDPLYRLVLANLYLQIGETKLARQTVKDYRNRWSNVPYFQNILKRIPDQ